MELTVQDPLENTGVVLIQDGLNQVLVALVVVILGVPVPAHLI